MIDSEDMQFSDTFKHRVEQIDLIGFKFLWKILKCGFDEVERSVCEHKTHGDYCCYGVVNNREVRFYGIIKVYLVNKAAILLAALVSKSTGYLVAVFPRKWRAIRTKTCCLPIT